MVEQRGRVLGRRAGAAVVGLVVVLAGGCGRGVPDAAEVTAPQGVTASAPSSSFSTLAPEIQSAMEANAIPGAVVLVRDGHEAWAQAFGTRVVGEEDPVSVFDHFRVGSNTKTMVGTVILQLVEEGSIGLDDPVSRYRPDVPNGDNITIAQLLDMRSGLATYTNLEWFNAILDDDPTRVWDPEELAAIGLALPPAFPPGEGFLYSNTNTVLLGLIIEQLTGQSLTDVLAERVFRPLGLADTTFPPPADGTLSDPHPNGYLFGTNVSTLLDAALSARGAGGRRRRSAPPQRRLQPQPLMGLGGGGGDVHGGGSGHLVEALVGGGLLTAQLQQQRLDSVGPSTRPTRPARRTGWHWPGSVPCWATTAPCPDSSRSWVTTPTGT